MLDFLKIFPKEKTPALAVFFVGVCCGILAAVGNLDYMNIHLNVDGVWRYVLAGAAFCLLALGVWLLTWREEGDAKKSVSVDLSEFPSARTKTLKCKPVATVDSFLDKIYLDGLKGAVDPHRYGDMWVLFAPDTGQIFRNIGATYMRSRGEQVDSRKLMDVGISPGMKLRVVSKSAGLTIDATELLGGEQQSAMFPWGQLSTVENLLNLICQDVIPEENPVEYGKKWLLVCDGREFSELRLGDQRPLKQAGIREGSRMTIRRPFSFHRIDLAEHSQPESAEQNILPEILREPIAKRQNALSPNQKEILNFISLQEDEGKSRVTQEQISENFKHLGDKSGIFYRLEVLYLLGLVDKHPYGQDVNGVRHMYSTSKSYKVAFLGPISINSPSTIRRRKLD